MTVSGPVGVPDASDTLDEARARLLRTARGLTRTWAALLALMVLLVLVTLGALVVATTVRTTYVVLWSALLVGAAANLTRYWPRRVAQPGVVLDDGEAASLREAVDPRHGLRWPRAVRLVARPECEVTGGELVLGLPLAACLDEAELRELVTVALEVAEVEDERSVRWALRLAHGEVGRSLLGRGRPRLTWPTYRLTRSLRTQSAALVGDLENWGGAVHRARVAASVGRAERLRAHAAAEQVLEGWELVTSQWLVPAYERGRRHVAPFTGLRSFLGAADAEGLLPESGPSQPAHEVLPALVARHEPELSLQLAAERVETRPDRLRPIEWADHPAEVTVPQWRGLVAEVLDVARRQTREDADRLETLLALLEAGDGPALADATAPDHDLDPGRGGTAYAAWAEGFVPRVLTAAIGNAAVGAAYRPTWSWPHGTALVHDDGWELPVEAMVAEVLGMVREGRGLPAAYGELRVALAELGVDVHEPLWLDSATGRPEEPVGSFVARQGLAARLVVVTDRALHVFEHPHGPRLLDLLVRPRDPNHADPLRKRMLTVWQGDATDEVATVLTEDVALARFGPATGGLWWRLRLGDGLVLRGQGEGYAEEAVLAQWLGPRLATTWLHAPDRVRRTRDVVGRVGTTLGAAALLAAAVLGATGALAAAPVAVVGAAALAGAFVPDVAAELRLRRRAQRTSSPTGTSRSSVLPGGASGHAQAGSYAQDGA